MKHVLKPIYLTDATGARGTSGLALGSPVLEGPKDQ